MSKAKIETLLKEAFHPTVLEVIDQSHLHAGHAGNRQGGGHYDLIIAAPAFQGKTLLQSHRLIYNALAPVQPLIHALSIKVLP